MHLISGPKGILTGFGECFALEVVKLSKQHTVIGFLSWRLKETE